MFSNKVVKYNGEEFDCFKNSASPWFYIYNSNKSMLTDGDIIYFFSFNKISNYRLKKMISIIEDV